MRSLLGLEQVFSLQKTSKKQKLENVFQQILKSSVSRLVPRKPKVALMLAKRFVPAKNERGEFRLKKLLEKSHSTEKILNGTLVSPLLLQTKNLV